MESVTFKLPSLVLAGGFRGSDVLRGRGTG